MPRKEEGKEKDARRRLFLLVAGTGAVEDFWELPKVFSSQIQTHLPI